LAVAAHTSVVRKSEVKKLACRFMFLLQWDARLIEARNDGDFEYVQLEHTW
jgi:hypothetical protein